MGGCACKISNSFEIPLGFVVQLDFLIADGKLKDASVEIVKAFAENEHLSKQSKNMLRERQKLVVERLKELEAPVIAESASA